MLCDRIREGLKAIGDVARIKAALWDDAAVFEISECASFDYRNGGAGGVSIWSNAIVAPSFPSMGLEWRTDGLASPGVNRRALPRRMGVLVRSSEYPAGTTAKAAGIPVESDAEVRWRLDFDGLMQTPDGDAVVAVDQLSIAVGLGHDGRQPEPSVIGITHPQGNVEPAAMVRHHVLPHSPVFLALAMLNSVNRVVREEVPDAGVQTIRERRSKPPLLRHSVISVPGYSGGSGLPRGGTHDTPSLHVVKAHFKNRATGQFFWHQHMRGSYDKGVTLSTYEVGV